MENNSCGKTSMQKESEIASKLSKCWSTKKGIFTKKSADIIKCFYVGGWSLPGREKVEEDKLLHILQVGPVAPEARAESANSLGVPETEKNCKKKEKFVFASFSNSPKFFDVFPYVAPCHLLFQDINLKQGVNFNIKINIDN